MTTDQYIKENKTKTLSKGDKVVMHTCGEANFLKIMVRFGFVKQIAL